MVILNVWPLGKIEFIVKVPVRELASLVADSSAKDTTALIAPPVDPELMLAVSSDPPEEEL